MRRDSSIPFQTMRQIEVGRWSHMAVKWNIFYLFFLFKKKTTQCFGRLAVQLHFKLLRSVPSACEFAWRHPSFSIPIQLQCCNIFLIFFLKLNKKPNQKKPSNPRLPHPPQPKPNYGATNHTVANFNYSLPNRRQNI